MIWIFPFGFIVLNPSELHNAAISIYILILKRLV